MHTPKSQSLLLICSLALLSIIMISQAIHSSHTQRKLNQRLSDVEANVTQLMQNLRHESAACIQNKEKKRSLFGRVGTWPGYRFE